MSSLHRTELEVKLNGLRELMELKKTIYEQVKMELGECSPSRETRRAQAGAAAPGGRKRRLQLCRQTQRLQRPDLLGDSSHLLSASEMSPSRLGSAWEY